MLLGGQHIAAACHWMRKKILSENPTMREEQLPNSYRVCRAVVMKMDTPRRALISAAGYHQSTQQDSHPPTTADVLRMISRYNAEKLTNTGSAVISDDDLGNCMQAMGLLKGAETQMAGNIDMSLDEAMAAEERAVCTCYPPPPLSDATSRLSFHRSTTWCSCGGRRAASWRPTSAQRRPSLPRWKR